MNAIPDVMGFVAIGYNSAQIVGVRLRAMRVKITTHFNTVRFVVVVMVVGCVARPRTRFSTRCRVNRRATAACVGKPHTLRGCGLFQFIR